MERRAVKGSKSNIMNCIFEQVKISGQVVSLFYQTSSGEVHSPAHLSWVVKGENFYYLYNIFPTLTPVSVNLLERIVVA